MDETSKALVRRLRDPRFATRYFVGDGIDIGSGPDQLAQYDELLPLMRSCRSWDMPDGDAQELGAVPDASLDFAHASHCLEHLQDPFAAVRNWLRVLKPGGHLIVTVPDEDLYEQGVFPSTYNDDHKWTFTLCKAESWSPLSINLFELLGSVADIAQPLKVELLDTMHRYRLHRFDQTLTPVAECAIEFVLRKRTPAEIARKGRVPAG